MDKEEDMAEFASNGKANAGLATGIVGTSLSGLLALGSGLLGNGMLGWNNRACGCNEDHLVNRYELDKDQQIARLETENSLLQAEKHTDEKSLELYRYVDGRFREFEQAIAQQAVYNATNTSTIACLQGQVAQLQALTKCVIPTSSICPEPMPRYNSYVAPTATPAT